MKFRLKLTTSCIGALLPICYQYPLSAAIYRILDRADNEYAAFLHNKGYQKTNSLKSFKLFSFSDLKTPFKILNDRLLLLSNGIELLISFHLPHAAETFIKGLFMNQEIEIADKKSRVVLSISQVETIPTGLSLDKFQKVLLQPLSPVVCGLKNDRRQYDFLAPDDPAFVSQLMYNWKEKYRALHDSNLIDIAFADASMEVFFYRNPPKSRLITIKADTPAETKIRGFVNFQLSIQGQSDALELLLDSGVGVYNSLGMGYVVVN
jgi:CRISPR-associated endoribonuclease Cas6